MARQAVVVFVALALFATVAFAAEAEATKASLPVFAPVPTGAAGPTADSNEIGTVGGIGSDAAGAPLASGPSIADAVTAAGVGGPVADGVFGDSAESPKSGATTAQVSAVTVAAVATVSLLF